MINRKELDKLLKLQAISINEEEYDKFLNQIENIVDFVSTIEKVDTSNQNPVSKNKITVAPAPTTFEDQQEILKNIDHPIVSNSVQLEFDPTNG